MRTRLGKLLGEDQVRQIKMGTFHALCSKFLRKYASLVGLKGNYTISDADESCVIACLSKRLYANIVVFFGRSYQ